MRQGELGSLPVIVGLIIIWVYFSVSEENFLTAGNLTNLMLQITALGIIATGVVLVLLLGEIDLSVGIVSGLAAAVMAVLSVKHGWPGWAAILAALARRRSASALFQGFFDHLLPRARRSSSRWPACWPSRALLLYVLGDTGTINLTDSTIIDLANTFYSDYVGWIIAVVLLVPYVLLTLDRLPATIGGRARHRAAAPARAADGVVVIAGVIVGVAVIFNADRGVPLAMLIFVGVVILVDFITARTRPSAGTSTRSAATPRRRAGPASRSTRIRLIVFTLVLDARGARRHAARLAPVRGEPGVGRQRPAPQRDRRRGHRRHQPLRRPRHGVVGAARRAGDRVDLQRHGPARRSTRT